MIAENNKVFVAQFNRQTIVLKIYV